MRIKTIYICEGCNKESLDKDELEKHEVACFERIENEKAERERIKKLQEEFVDTFTIKNISQHINDFVKKTNNDYFKDLEFKLRYSSDVSNSHSCPKNGVRNWGHDPDKPTGYPGWHGSVKGRYSRKGYTLSNYLGSSPSRNGSLPRVPGIHHGTGGGTGKEFQYSISIFASDFPLLKNEIAKLMLKDKI